MTSFQLVSEDSTTGEPPPAPAATVTVDADSPSKDEKAAASNQVSRLAVCFSEYF